ncbi:uncharacterized protein [Asterias amurensis]|uniref:uncharacterized protein isoform X1 n=1 Tax=Asterias amurensis TaxID=7602 RepID=UPI003AB71E54
MAYHPQLILLGIICCQMIFLIPGAYSQVENITLQVDFPSSNPSFQGFPSLYLSDKFNITIEVLFGSIGEQAKLSLETPDEFDMVSSDNLTISYGSNLVKNDSSQVTSLRTQLDVTFGFVDIINGTNEISSENTIYLVYPVFVQNFQDSGYLFNITLSVEYGSAYENVTTVSRVLSYRGPEVNITETLQTTSGQTFNFDRELQTSVSFKIPPGSWIMSETQIVLDFTSVDIPLINLDVLSCVASSSSPNITFSNPGSQNVTSVNDTTLTTAYITTQTSTGSVSRRKRDASSVGSVAETSLVWNLYEIANVGDQDETVDFLVTGVIRQTENMTTGKQISYSFSMNLNEEWVPFNSEVLTIWEPDLMIDKTVSVLSTEVAGDDYTLSYLLFTATLYHSNLSTAPAYGIVFTDNVDGLRLEYFKDLVPAYGTDGFVTTAEELIYQVEELTLGDTLTISYKAYFTADTVTNLIGQSMTRATIATWHSMPTQEITTEYPGRSYGPISAETCVDLNETQEESLLLNHGLAAVFFFVALLIGCIIVAIIVLIVIKCCRRGPYATVQPTGKYASGSPSKQAGLVMSPRGGAKSGLSTLKEHCLIAIDDSIILVLALKDKMRKMLEFDNLDIWWTITIDIQLEQQRLDAMVDSIINLINKWTAEGAIPKKVSDKSNKKLQRKMKDLNKTLEDEYKEECRELSKRLSTQNKGKLADLQKKHKTEYNGILTKTKGMTEQERKEIMSLLRKQHEAEKNEVTQALKMQQDELQEKTRKEIAIRKRLAVKALQQECLDEVILQSKLDENAAMRLLREHHSNTADLESAMDNELSRQRMLLEEKLAKRRALVQSNESFEDHNRQILNTMATQTLGAIDDLEKDDKITEEQAERYVEKLRQEFMAAKVAYDKERGKQEEGLHKRMSELKRRKLDERAREHKQQLDQFEKEQKSKLENNNLDPSQYTEAKLNLLASHRTEMHELELSLDDDAGKQLEELHKQLANQTKTKINENKQGLFKELMSQGMTERLKNEILEQHERDVERLSEEHEEQRMKQERLLKKRLAKHRQEWIKRKQDEKQEQQMIRDHEEKVVGHILASQLAISEEDRQRILDEHEKQQVALESSLAFSKLRQRRLLEEKLAQKRARHMAKLQKKQEQEVQRDARKRQLAESDEEDEESQQELMKKHAEEKIALLTDDSNEDFEDELEAVRVEMMQERVGALKEQEEQLGTLVAKLQLERSREMATIEEQQKALWQLKMNMLDNMTENGILRNADCKKVIDTHQKEAKNLENKLNAEREKQEKEFKRRLREKLADRELMFTNKQEEELRFLVENEKNKTSARLKRVALKHKHLMQMEEFRHNLEVEVNQALEDLRRRFEINRLKQLQEQELQFISGLVKHGGFNSTELRNVLFLLFPGKTQEELAPLLKRMYNKEEGEDIEEDDGDSLDNGNKKRASSNRSLETNRKNTNSESRLEEKIKLSILGNVSSSAVSTPTREKRKPSKLLGRLKKNKQKKKKLAPIRNDQDPYDRPYQGGALPGIGMARPDPLGGVATPDEDSEGDRRKRLDSDSDEEEERRPLKKQGRPQGKSDYSY